VPDEHYTAAPRRAAYDRRQLINRINGTVPSAAVRGFQHEIVGALNRAWSVQQRIDGSAQISGEDEIRAVRAQQDAGRSEDMTVAPESRPGTARKAQVHLECDRLDALRGTLGVCARVQRQRNRVPRIAVSVGILRFLLLQMARVGQHDRGAVDGRGL
jgi:hypothetical protein